MEARYIKMNNSKNQLSLGNFCKIVKELSLNKTFANQTEVFYAIFGVDNVSDSTINNYCIGYRSIGTEFKQIYIKRKKYPNKEFDETLGTIISILKGQIYHLESHEELLKHLKEDIIKKFSVELYNLAKNDKSVNIEFTKKIYNMLEKNQTYDFLCEILIYIVLEKKQPIYIENSKIEIIENILNSTYISLNELEQFLKVQLQDGINYTYSIKRLAKEKNPYAAFELGNMEYKGEMKGYPRYVKSYEYFKIAAEKKHPRANWLIGKMLFYGQIGNKTKEDYEEALKYLKVAESLGSIAATNSIGKYYLDKEKNEEKAIKYFEKASKSNYVYAYNNLGMIYEAKKDMEKAIEYYTKSADLEESWALNKLGNFYREGKHIKKDMEKAYTCYKKALEAPEYILNHWAYFNLAKYFYLEGNYSTKTEKDTEKAIKYFEKAKEKEIIEAYPELINIYIDKYINNRKEEYLNKINNYIKEFSLKKEYHKYEKQIEEKINNIKNKGFVLIKKIDI